MAKYWVYVTGSVYMPVEADDSDDAEMMALETWDEFTQFYTVDRFATYIEKEEE